LTAPRVLAKLRPYDARAGMDAAMALRATSVIEQAIAQRGPRTRPELAQVLRSGGPGETSNWLVGHLLMHAELRGVICSGPPRGTEQTYALLDEQAPSRITLSNDEAAVELARRYFQSHAPATELDYRWWSGLSAGDARRGIEALGRAVERITADGLTYVMWRESAVPRGPHGSAQLLQPFDELVVAYSESRHVLDAAGLVRDHKPDGLLTRSVVVNGQVAGRWKRTLARRQLLRLDLLRPLTARELAAVAAAVDRFAGFLGEPLEMHLTAGG
jgi:hypothetical protein